MKMTKKWLLGVAVLAALSFGFVGCSEEDDDDDSINGAEVVVDNTDSTAATYNGTKRAYKSTKLKHLGTLARVELRDQKVTTASDGSDATGVIGIIWDLKKASKAVDKYTDNSNDEITVDELTGEVADDTLNFLIVGLRNGGKDHAGKINYYVSKFYNVSNANDFNFGAGTETYNSSTKTYSYTYYNVDNDAEGMAKYTSDSSKAYELDITSKLNDGKTFVDAGDTSQYLTSDGTIYAWVDIYPANRKGLRRKYGVRYDTYAKEEYNGYFIVDIYLGDADYDPEKVDNPTPAATIEIPPQYTGYSDTNKSIPQAKAARYGAAYANKVMSGYIKYDKTYADAEVVEDAE